MGNARSEGDSKAYLIGASPGKREALHHFEERQHTMRLTGESHARSTSVHPGMCEARCPASQRGQASMEHTHLSSNSSPKRVSCRSNDSANTYSQLTPDGTSRSLSTIHIEDRCHSYPIETFPAPPRRFCALLSAHSTRLGGCWCQPERTRRLRRWPGSSQSSRAVLRF